MTKEEYDKFIGKDCSDVSTFDKLLVGATIVGAVYLMKKISESAGDERGWFDWLFKRREDK